MNSPREVIADWSARLLANPESFQDIGATYKFVVQGGTGGVWRLKCRRPAAITEGDGPADCTVMISDVDFMELASKRLNPQVAYLSGRIQVSGNVTLALKLGELM